MHAAIGDIPAGIIAAIPFGSLFHWLHGVGSSVCGKTRPRNDDMIAALNNSSASGEQR